MKKIAAMLLCLCLIVAFPLTAFAKNTDGGDTHISTVVPGFHKITVNADGAEAFINGTASKEFTVERLSEPTVVFKPESGKRISGVLLNGEDITDKITDDSYTLEPVYEDKIMTVTTEVYIEPPTENPSATQPTTEKPTTGIEPTTNPPTGNQGNSSTGGNNANNQGKNPLQTGESFNIALLIVFMISFIFIITLSRRHTKKIK